MGEVDSLFEIKKCIYGVRWNLPHSDFSRPDPIRITVDKDKCLGKDECGLCLEACGYDAPQFGAEDNPKMQKCDLCMERWAQGKKPICVISCPMQAIDAGPMDELKVKYGNCSSEAEGFKYNKELEPSIIFNCKKDKKNLPSRKTEISPAIPNGKTSK